jgi:hypothetical protein
MRRLVFALVLLVSPSVRAQQIARDKYLDLLPPIPKLLSQTQASVHFELYGRQGAPEFVDANGNGIDDQREVVLHELAHRFSPILRRNNFSIPVDFKSVLGQGAVLHVDTWRAGGLIGSERIPLFRTHLAGAGMLAEAENPLLAALVAEFLPSRPESRFVHPEEDTERVLFLDFPGSDPSSWRTAYQHTPAEAAAAYVHFFVHADSAAAGYFLIAQYWFFYPFNDAANNHEGDWEHVNVAITTDAAIAQRPGAQLSDVQLASLLAGATPADRLKIAFVDYYFHESVITLDYTVAYRAVASSERPLSDRVSVWRDTSFVRRTVLRRLGVGNGDLATHPIGFIGGNNKGPDELLTLRPRFRGSFNRNSHGTYPFPGIWQAVGPLGSTEHVPGRPVPELGGEARSWDDLRQHLTQEKFVAFRRENLILVPDWECIEPLLESDASAREEWSWLVLPLRWGYPATESPGAGAIKHVDLGNLSPEGPPFQPGWNRIGAAGWRVYDPEVLRVMLAPTSPFDKMTSGWGFLNLPVALLGFLPGWNMVATQLMPWLTGTVSVFHSTLPRTFRPRDQVYRFTSLYAGPYTQTGGDEFAMLLPGADHPAITQQTQSDGEEANRTALKRSFASGMRIGFAAHYGPKFTVENTYSTNHARLAADYTDAAGSNIAHLNAALQTRDLTGGFRYTIARAGTGTWQAFLKGGYGWTWYVVDELSVNGAAADYRERSGYAVSILPSAKWWPNSWYTGAGLELFRSRRGWLLGQLGYGLRADFTSQHHRLGARSPGEKSLGSAHRNDFSIYAVLGW